MRKAMFFDRDGVLNRPIPRKMRPSDTKSVLTSPRTMGEFELFAEDVKDVVAKVKGKGYLAIVITNQPGLAYNEIAPETYDAMRAHLRSLGFDDIFTCPHDEESSCRCRKPKPGMLFEAADKWNISLKYSYFIGDSASDLQAAEAARCGGILIRRPHNSKLHAEVEISDLRQLPRMLP